MAQITAMFPIDINSATVRQLTQLPGIAKNLAYRLVNHRARHGLFASWEELKEVKGFPVERLAEIKARATLICRDEEGIRCKPPRHLESTHLEEIQKKPAGYTRAARRTRRPARLDGSSGSRH